MDTSKSPASDVTPLRDTPGYSDSKSRHTLQFYYDAVKLGLLVRLPVEVDAAAVKFCKEHFPRSTMVSRPGGLRQDGTTFDPYHIRICGISDMPTALAKHRIFSVLESTAVSADSLVWGDIFSYRHPFGSPENPTDIIAVGVGGPFIAELKRRMLFEAGIDIRFTPLLSKRTQIHVVVMILKEKKMT